VRIGSDVHQSFNANGLKSIEQLASHYVLKILSEERQGFEKGEETTSFVQDLALNFPI
jgi:hypothetical protein